MTRIEIPEFAPIIVGLGGTTRPNSTSERAVKVALSYAAKMGATTMLFGGVQLMLPLYDPNNEDRTEAAHELVKALRVADGIILGSPGYHGSISGLIKNALDYTEDLRDDPKVYFGGRAVGCIGCAAGWQAANSTLTTIRSIVHALRGWPSPLGVTINSAEPVFDTDGTCVDEKTAQSMRTMVEQVVRFARMRFLARAVDPSWEYWAKTGEEHPPLRLIS